MCSEVFFSPTSKLANVPIVTTSYLSKFFIGMRTGLLIVFPNNHLLLSYFLTRVSQLKIVKKLIIYLRLSS